MVRESHELQSWECQLFPSLVAELSPKQSDLCRRRSGWLMRLEESGPNKQTELAEELGLEGYAMSRLLAKLELHRYIVRRREGTDKIVSLREER